MPLIAINMTVAHEHVSKIERRTRLMKEHGWGILNTLPYKKTRLGIPIFGSDFWNPHWKQNLIPFSIPKILVDFFFEFHC